MQSVELLHSIFYYNKLSRGAWQRLFFRLPVINHKFFNVSLWATAFSRGPFMVGFFLGRFGHVPNKRCHALRDSLL